MKKAIVFIVLLSPILIFGQKGFFELSYPSISKNELEGLFSAAARFKLRGKPTNQGLFIGGFGAYTQFKSENDIQNQLFMAGPNFSFNYEISAQITLYPFFNVGYSFLKSDESGFNGMNTQVGINFMNANFGHWWGLHLSYNRIFMIQDESQKRDESFGIVNTGIHFSLWK